MKDHGVTSPIFQKNRVFCRIDAAIYNIGFVLKLFSAHDEL